MHLQNLNQFDTWNSFISHIVVYREVQYRSDFFWHFQTTSHWKLCIAEYCFVNSTWFNVFTEIVAVWLLEFIYYTYCCLYGGAISFQHFWHFQSKFPWKVMHWLSNVLLNRHNLMCLQKLTQFHSWNSFITHILVYMEEQYRFNILDISNTLPMESYALIV